jgi:hypothetical protein
MTTFVGDKYDNRYLSLVGWEATAEGAGAGYKFFFSEENMRFVQTEVMRLLRPFGLNVRVTMEVIGGLFSDLIRSQNPVLGDIHTRYTIPQADPRNDAKSLTVQAINRLVNEILGEQQQACCNSKLSVWSTVKGDFSAYGIRSHAPIRVKKNDHLKGVFMMNY